MTTDNPKYTINLVTCDENPVRPLHVIEGIIGQEIVKKKLLFLVQSHSIATPFPTLLFAGSQGLGKSFMAQKVADALGRDFVEVNCSGIATKEDFVENVLLAKIVGNKEKTLLLDEAHKLTSEVTTLLLTLTNPNLSYTNTLNYKEDIDIVYNFSKINIILATTDSYMICRPLANRAKVIYFNMYEKQEVLDILSFYLGDIKTNCSTQVAEEIAYACRERARDAFLLSQDIVRYVNLYNLPCFSDKDWREIKTILDIQLLGLNSTELLLFKKIHENQPISCKNLALQLGVNESNIESELEVRLRELGLIDNTNQGRILSPKGKDLIEKGILV